MFARSGQRSFRVALIPAALLPSVLGAQVPRSASVVDGMVSDTNLVALAGASVMVLGSSLRVTTGENGRFRIVGVPAGQHVLTVHRVGYTPVSAGIQVGKADTLRLSFAMKRVATELDTVTVSAGALVTRMTEFEQRRKLGFGTFITAEQIKQRSPITLGEVLRGIPSIAISPGLYNQVASSTRSSRCPIQVVLDDVLLPPPTNLANLVAPSEVMGIEVYPGPATAPPQFKSTNACGVILIWTK